MMHRLYLLGAVGLMTAILTVMADAGTQTIRTAAAVQASPQFWWENTPTPSPTVPPTNTPVPTSTPTPTNTPTPGPGTVLFGEAESEVLSIWTSESSSWKYFDGQLLHDGTETSAIIAPFVPTAANYAVEAQIQLVRAPESGCGFGIFARAEDESVDFFSGYVEGYLAELSCDQAVIRSSYEELKATSSTVDDAWHIYRIEVQGNHITLSVDGILLLETRDNRYISSGQVGLWCNRGTQIAVRSFTVKAPSPRDSQPNATPQQDAG